MENDENFVNIDKLRIKKVNKTHHMLIGSFVLHKDLGNDYNLLCLAYKKAGNDYKLMPFKIGPTKFCDFIQSEKMLYPELLLVSDFPPLDTCPWPAGTYTINGYHPDLSKIPPFIESNDYMVKCLVKDGETVLNGMQIYGTVLSVPVG